MGGPTSLHFALMLTDLSLLTAGTRFDLSKVRDNVSIVGLGFADKISSSPHKTTADAGPFPSLEFRSRHHPFTPVKVSYYVPQARVGTKNSSRFAAMSMWLVVGARFWKSPSFFPPKDLPKDKPVTAARDARTRNSNTTCCSHLAGGTSKGASLAVVRDDMCVRGPAGLVSGPPRADGQAKKKKKRDFHAEIRWESLVSEAAQQRQVYQITFAKILIKDISLSIPTEISFLCFQPPPPPPSYPLQPPPFYFHRN